MPWLLTGTVRYLLIHVVRVQNKDIRDDPCCNAVYKRTTDTLEEKGVRSDEDPLSNTSADTLTDADLERLFVNLMWCAQEMVGSNKVLLAWCPLSVE